MPLFDFECSVCAAREIDVASVKCDPDAVAPVHCGKKMDVLLLGSRASVQVFEPYETANMHPEGKMLKVRNSGDLRRFEREFGVRRADADTVCVGGKFERKREHGKRTYI